MSFSKSQYPGNRSAGNRAFAITTSLLVGLVLAWSHAAGALRITEVQFDPVAFGFDASGATDAARFAGESIPARIEAAVVFA